jgi:HlyD family secretion protein
MRGKWMKRAGVGAGLAVVVAGFAWLLWPQPVYVDIGRAVRAPMRTVITQEGINRIRKTYVVSAPVNGTLERISLEAGDKVAAATTIVARIRPSQPPIYDARTQLELERAVETAKAAKDLAQAELRRAEANVNFAKIALGRAMKQRGTETLSQPAFEKAQLEMSVAVETAATARAQLDLRQHDLELAEARLLPEPAARDQISAKDCCVELMSPVNGVILSISKSSESEVALGTPLMEIGDPADSEVVVDILSSDAVGLRKGTAALIDNWGKTNELAAVLREVEPIAFTKISALGIEEQRVKALLDFSGPPHERAGLGHNYRVNVKIVTWESQDVLQVPVSALFRNGNRWSVFLARNSVALLTPVEIGMMNDSDAQVVDGLRENDAVILHPSDNVANGVRIEVRPPENG